MENDVLVVIVSYKDVGKLHGCLSSLRNQTYKNFDVIVWDNSGACYDNTQKYFPEFTVYKSQENLLWTPAINKSIENYMNDNHKYLLIMNFDILLPNVAIERMVKTFDSLPDNPGIIAPAGSALGGLQDYVSHKEIPSHEFWQTDLQDALKDRECERSTYLSGAIQFLKREVWENVGTLDDEMPLGADDFDYSIRTKEAGYSLWECIIYMLNILVMLPEIQITGINMVDRVGKDLTKNIMDILQPKKRQLSPYGAQNTIRNFQLGPVFHMKKRLLEVS